MCSRTGAIATLCDGSRYAPAPLNETEIAALAVDSLAGAAAHVEGDYPEWLDPHLQRVFGEERATEGAALSSRAPLDLRVNTLAAERDAILPKLEHFAAEPTRWSPLGIRIRLGADAKSPAIHAEPLLSRARSKSRTRARSLLGSWPMPSPASR